MRDMCFQRTSRSLSATNISLLNVRITVKLRANVGLHSLGRKNTLHVRHALIHKSGYR